MIDGKISGKQATHMMILFLLGSSLVTGGSMIAKQDSWASALVGMIMALPVVAIYGSLCKTAQGKDVFDMAYLAFGKIGGVIITALFCMYTIHLGALVIKNFSEYFQVVTIPETPQAVTAICLALLAYYSISKGIEVLGRGAVFMMPIVLVVILLLTVLSLKYTNIENLKPMFNHNLKPILSGAYALFTFPFAETVVFVTVFSVVDTKKSPVKLYLIAILFAGGLLSVLVAVAIMILGLPLVASLYFPSYSAAGVIDIGNFISRIEVLVSWNYIIFGVIKVSVCLFVSCKGIAKLFNLKNYKVPAAPTITIMVAISLFVYESTMQMFGFLDIYKIYAPFFEVVIPLALLVALKIKAKKKSLG